jgi:hypothetical protein
MIDPIDALADVIGTAGLVRALPRVPRPRVDGRRYADGSGPSRRSWGRSGLKGAYPTPAGRYAAKVRYAGRVHCCGVFDTAEEAAAAAARKAGELKGEQ